MFLNNNKNAENKTKKRKRFLLKQKKENMI